MLPLSPNKSRFCCRNEESKGTNMKTGLALVAMWLAATYLTPAQAQTTATFGKTAVGTIPSAGLSADFKRASRFTLAEPGTVQELCAYLDGNGGGTGLQYVELALYTDANGVPGTKVADTYNWALQNGAPAQWICRSALHITPLPAGQYWIAIQSSAPGGVIRDFYDGAADWYGNADAFEDGPANAFGSGSAGSGTLSAYVRYYPASQVSSAGRMTIGTLPSKGMTANFKRGSSFLMPQRGRLWGITAYLDGRGSANSDDQQAYRYVIYKDASGVPGEKVYEGMTSYMRGTWAPAWISEWVYPAVAPTLDPGRYWLTIHTGGLVAFEGGLTDTGGVIRNFADGSGNWYGNNDAFSDGASTPFGPGSTGNGTISAYISYRPGTITTGELGRHDIATTPSRGLDANVIRWSTFLMQDTGATLTALHAYLDGLGAASGSQAIRMVAYGFDYIRHMDGTADEFYYKLAESDVVTISAGMQPQWVDFPVTPVLVPDNPPAYVLIGIQSGGPNAVVRDYGDNRSDLGANWNSRPDAFADGAVDTFPTNDPTIKSGDVTLSVYASYSLPPPQ
jgi:hypothetical protein